LMSARKSLSEGHSPGSLTGGSGVGTVVTVGGSGVGSSEMEGLVRLLLPHAMQATSRESEAIRIVAFLGIQDLN
jgi:hypothetical protein